MAVLPPDPLFCLRADMGHIHSLCFVERVLRTEGGDTTITDVLLAATEDGYVYFWDLETNRVKYKQKMGSSIQAIHAYENVIITQEKCGDVNVWIDTTQVTSNENEPTKRQSNGSESEFGGELVTDLVEKLEHIWENEKVESEKVESQKENEAIGESEAQMTVVSEARKDETKVTAKTDKIEQNKSKYEISKVYECASGFCKSVLFEDKLILPQRGCIDVVDIDTLKLTKKFEANRGDFGQTMCVQKVRIEARFYILAGYETGDILLWDYEASTCVSHIKLRKCITSITFDAVTLRGICGNASNILQIFTIDRSFNISLKCEISMTNDGCNIVKLRDDRKIFVSGGWDGRLRLFSWKSLRLLAVLSDHKGGITDVQFSRTPVKRWGSNILAASSADGIISLWSLYN